MGKQQVGGGASRLGHQVPHSYSALLAPYWETPTVRYPCAFGTHWRRVGVLTSSYRSPVAFFFLPSYRASFLLPFPSSMVMVLFFLVAVLMVLALVGLLLWFFFLGES